MRRTTSIPLASANLLRRADPRAWIRSTVWATMAASTVCVILYSEIPLLQQRDELAHLKELRWLLFPHAVGATLAFLIGPLQFSDRLRTRHRRIHRGIGTAYMLSVSLAAPLAIVATVYSHYPKAMYFRVAIGFQATAWLASTLTGVCQAIRVRFAAHREWMIRSYSVTFTFVATRILQPIPAWNHLGRFWFAAAIIIFTVLALNIPRLDSVFRKYKKHPSSVGQAQPEPPSIS